MIKESFTVRRVYQQQKYQGKPHFHDVNEILIATKGAACMTIDSKVYDITGGSILFISQGTLHSKENLETEDVNSYVFHYPVSLLSELSTPKTNLYQIFSEYNGCISLSKKDQNALLKEISSLIILKDNEDKTFGNDLNDIITFANILLYSTKLLSKAESNRGNTAYSRYRDEEGISEIITYIDSHLGDELSLDNLSKIFYMNKFNLCHVFKEKTGFTVNVYINMRRIQLASDYLKQGLPVNDVAKMAGFNSTSHFIRTFKAMVKTTPKKYAQLYREGQNVSVSYNLFDLSKNQ